MAWRRIGDRRQAIIWTNADPVHQRIYAALGGDELSQGHGNLFEDWVSVEGINRYPILKSVALAW